MVLTSGPIGSLQFLAIVLLLALGNCPIVCSFEFFSVDGESIEITSKFTKNVTSNATSDITSNATSDVTLTRNETLTNETSAPTVSAAPTTSFAPSSAPTVSAAPSSPPSISFAPSVSSAPSSVPTIRDCEASHYDCYGCLQKGCYWCPTDGLCFETPEYIERNTNTAKLWPDRRHNCKTPESFTQTTCTSPYNFFEDPLYSAQNWIFANVKIVPVWERGYFGKGVRVRINDAGIETTHPEFFGRLDLNASCPNGTATSLTDDHGMTVASLLGANGNNSDCGVGIAPQVTMSSCVLGTLDVLDMLVYELDSFDISQNSWAYEGCGPLSQAQLNSAGDRRLQNECPFVYRPFEGYILSPCDKCNFTTPEMLGPECIDSIATHCEWFSLEDRKGCMEYLDLILLKANPASKGECHFGMLPEEAIDAFTRGITEGRNGKGIIYVFAAGNEFHLGDNTNFQGFGSNTRFTIPVAAIGKPGKISSFSTPGASVFVAAPGGDYKQSVTNIIAASNDGTCSMKADGTSFAAPIVSGVVALMLEANPELTWRDVQQILARTAQVYNDGDDPTFAKNGAGLVHSNRYGFGIVSADAAVAMAENWVNIGKEISLVQEGSGSEVIVDSPNNVTKLKLTVDSGDIDFETETVYLYVKVDHSSRGHLRIDLISPSGMLSVMSPGGRPDNMQSGWMKFTSVRYWDEDPNGDWTITITDTTNGTVADCIDYEDYVFPYLEDGTLNITCLPKDFGTISRFCLNGSVHPEAYIPSQCNKIGDETLCNLLERFNSTEYNGMTGPEACCSCGGGFHPSELPETVVEWKIVIYGHEKSTMEGFFSGVGNDVVLGRWGGRGVNYEGKRVSFPTPEEMKALKIEALGGVRDMWGGIRGRKTRG